MKEKTALIFSLIATIIIIVGLSVVFGKLGFHTYIDYGETITIQHHLYDEEKDGSVTNLGWYLLVVPSMLGWRLYHWFISGEIFGNLNYAQRLTWNYWFVGLTVATILTELMYMLPLHYIIHNIGSLVILFGTGWLLFRSYDVKLTAYDKREREAEKE